LIQRRKPLVAVGAEAAGAGVGAAGCLTAGAPVGAGLLQSATGRVEKLDRRSRFDVSAAGAEALSPSSPYDSIQPGSRINVRGGEDSPSAARTVSGKQAAPAKKSTKWEVEHRSVATRVSPWSIWSIARNDRSRGIESGRCARKWGNGRRPSVLGPEQTTASCVPSLSKPEPPV
jgi:hypothetical protein